MGKGAVEAVGAWAGADPGPGYRSLSGSCPGAAGSPLTRGLAPLRLPAVRSRMRTAPVPSSRSTCEQHFPSGERKSGRNKKNFSRPNQGLEMKSRVPPGLFSGCERTTLTSTVAGCIFTERNYFKLFGTERGAKVIPGQFPP